MHNRGEYCGQEGSGIKLNGDQDFTKSCGKNSVNHDGPGHQAKVKRPMAWTKEQC